MDKLAYAVSVAESGNCTHSVSNNCHGLMTWVDGPRRLKRFSSTDDSFEDFKAVWTRVYGERLPTLQDAIKYTGNHRAKTWLSIVLDKYHN